MKNKQKIFVSLLLICTASILFSCASNDVEKEIENEIESPSLNEDTVEQFLNEEQKASEKSEIDENTAETESKNDDALDEGNETLSNSDSENNGLELEEIIEPEVFDLEPSEEEAILPTEIEAEPVTKEEMENPDEQAGLENQAENPEGKNIELSSENQAEEPENTKLQTTEAADNLNALTENNADAENSVENSNTETENQETNPEDENTIEITDDVEEKEAEKVQIIPSRSVTVKMNEYLDVTYPGSGWIYMGPADGIKLLNYSGRKLGSSSKETCFSLFAKSDGKTILHFYKNDDLTGNYVDDYLEVTVLKEKGDSKNHVKAPEWRNNKTALKNNQKKAEVSTTEGSEALASPSKKAETASQALTEAAAESKKAETVKETKQSELKTNTTNKSSVQNTENAVENFTDEVSEVVEVIDTDKTLQNAKKYLEAKEYEKALEEITSFLNNSSTKRDEGLYVEGQILEANSSIQNIQKAINAYTTLTKNYPSSKFWDKANKRIIYLQRFYLQAR